MYVHHDTGCFPGVVIQGQVAISTCIKDYNGMRSLTISGPQVPTIDYRSFYEMIWVNITDIINGKFDGILFERLEIINMFDYILFDSMTSSIIQIYNCDIKGLIYFQQIDILHFKYCVLYFDEHTHIFLDINYLFFEDSELYKEGNSQINEY